jgi:hypothetical protein
MIIFEDVGIVCRVLRVIFDLFEPVFSFLAGSTKENLVDVLGDLAG